ncbi:MAG: hypothetical protein ABIR06_22745 [Cyclobacteriaceae bacterium]
MKFKEIIKPLLVAAMLAGGLFACTYDIIEPKTSEVPDSVSFSLNVLPIFTKSCNISGCHSKAGIPPDLSEQNAYIRLTFFGYIYTDAPEESIIYQKISTGTMKQNATDQDRAMILKWIEQGALDN